MPTGPVVSGKPVEIAFIWDNGGEELKTCCGSIGKFGGALKNPMAPLGKAVCGCNHADWKPVLQQLIVIQFWTAALLSPGLLVFLLFGLTVAFSGVLLSLVIQGVITAFLLSWMMWYSLSNRETACCCCILAVLEHPLVGALWGILMVANGAQLILRSFTFLNGLFGFGGVVMFVGNCVYAVVCIFCGVAAIRVGMAQSGIEVPAMPNKGVGNAAPEEKPAAEAAPEKPADTAADAV